MKAAIIGIVAVIVIGAGAFFALHKSPAKTNASTSTQSSSSSNQNLPDTITFDGSSFSPGTITVKSGTTMTIKNTSSQDMAFNSNPHPVHTDDTDLNVGDVPAGQSKTFTVTKTGSYGYHDHLDPSIMGKITID